MSGGEPLFGSDSGEAAGLNINLETPARDLLPGQTHASVFWLTWDYEQDTVLRNIMHLRQQSGFSAWSSRMKKETVQGMTFTCRDPQLVFLFQILKSCATWLVRKDSFGSPFISASTDNEPVSLTEIAVGTPGFIMLGKARQLRTCLETWLDQRTEVGELAAAIITLERYYRGTHDQDWMRDRKFYLEEMLDSLTQYDANQDGLPEYFGAPALDSESYNSFLGRSSVRRRDGQYIAESIAAVEAFRSGVRLLQVIGSRDAQTAVSRYQHLAEQGERTLETKYWKSRLGMNGFYANMWLPKRSESKPHRSINVVSFIQYGIGIPERKTAVFRELWHNPAWRSVGGVYRTVPEDDAEFAEESAAGRGRINYYQSHEVLLCGLREPSEATEAVVRLRAYAQYLLLNPRTMGWTSRTMEKLNGIDFSMFNFIELLVSGLGGLKADLDGIRVRIPRYKQDLQVRIRDLACGPGTIDLEVLGSGCGGRMQVNGKPFRDNGLISWSMLAAGKVTIRIERDGSTASLAGEVGTAAEKFGLEHPETSSIKK